MFKCSQHGWDSHDAYCPRCIQHGWHSHDVSNEYNKLKENNKKLREALQVILEATEAADQSGLYQVTTKLIAACARYALIEDK